MRQLINPRRGMTLIELMVSMVVVVILLGVAAPFLGDFITNSRLRESGNSVYAEALYAQSEALKRNGTVRLAVSATETSVIDTSVNPNVTLRTRAFTQGISATAINVDFGSDGMTRPRGTQVNIDLAYAATLCNGEFRCPRVAIDAGGSVRLCGNKLSSC